MQGKSRTALAVVIAALALIVSAGAGATASLMITGKQIKDGTVTTKDVKNRSLKAKDFSAKAKSKLRGPAGPAGPRGDTGEKGATGPAGLSGFEVITDTVSVAALGTNSVSAACPSGKKAISATAGYAAAPVVDLDSLFSQVTRTSDNAFSASGLNLLLLDSQALTLDVVCATVPD